MEPLPDWGPPPCSPAPAADALRLALSLLLLRAPPCALAMPSCKEEEFPTGAMCCPKCRPGLGQVTRRNCTTWTNTVCGCGRGHVCEQQDGDACVQCRPHSVCRPGQRVRETGTQWQDTLCEDCQPGTYSAGGTQAACTPWTRCSGPLAWESAPGTISSDVTCSSRGPVTIIIIISLILVIAVISVPLVLRAIRHRRSRGELAFPGVLLPVPTLEGTGKWTERNKSQDLQASRVQPDVTTEPVEETASLFPQRDRHLTHGRGMQAPEPSPRGSASHPVPHGPDSGSGEPRDPLLEASPHLAEGETTCCAGGLGPPASPHRAPEVPTSPS